MIISGQVGADELGEQSGWKLSKESSDRTTSPRVTLGRQFTGAGESKSCRGKMVTLCQENIVTHKYFNAFKCPVWVRPFIPLYSNMTLTDSRLTD